MKNDHLTDEEFIRAWAVFAGSRLITKDDARRLHAIADQIERFSNTDMQLDAIVTISCGHPRSVKNNSIAVGHVLWCAYCKSNVCVLAIQCVTIDPPVT